MSIPVRIYRILLMITVIQRLEDGHLSVLRLMTMKLLIILKLMQLIMKWNWLILETKKYLEIDLRPVEEMP